MKKNIESSETPKPDTKSSIIETSQSMDGNINKVVRDRIDSLTLITYGIMIVLFIGFISLFVATTSMLINSWEGKAENYQILINKINKINNRINDIDNKVDNYYKDKVTKKNK